MRGIRETEEERGKMGRDTERSGGRKTCSQTWLQRFIVGHNLANLGCPDSTGHV